MAEIRKLQLNISADTKGLKQISKEAKGVSKELGGLVFTEPGELLLNRPQQNSLASMPMIAAQSRPSVVRHEVSISGDINLNTNNPRIAEAATRVFIDEFGTRFTDKFKKALGNTIDPGTPNPREAVRRAVKKNIH